jgi:hypothetical protein
METKWNGTIERLKAQGGLAYLLQKKIICFSIDYAIALL